MATRSSPTTNGRRLASPEETDVLALEDVAKLFPIKKGVWRKTVAHVRAVDGIDLRVGQAETLALVGESGSGKTTLGRLVVRALDPTSGVVRLRTESGWVDLATLEGDRLRAVRRNIHMIFQDPYSSLNPRMTVLDIVKEPLVHNGIAKGKEARDRVVETLELVGLGSRHLHRYPHAFSGGQRQRIGIARSLVSRPTLIVCDESVSALDVSIQAQILNLLKDLQESLGISYLFISHDLAVVEHVSRRVAVMYLGKLVELAGTEELFSQPRHPYTEALLSAVPIADPESRRPRIILRGEVASAAHVPAGCSFHPRCPYATGICEQEAPAWREVVSGRRVACHHAEELELRGVAVSD